MLWLLQNHPPGRLDLRSAFPKVSFRLKAPMKRTYIQVDTVSRSFGNSKMRTHDPVLQSQNVLLHGVIDSGTP
jgi:hypothetical protein